MSVVKGLSGFIVGLGVGGAALTGVASFVPQFEGFASLESSETEQTAKDTKPVEVVPEAEEIAVSEENTAEEAVPEKTKPEVDEPDVEIAEKTEEPATESAPEIKEEEIAVIVPEPKEGLTDTETPEKAEPEQEKKKINLPTIQPEEPKEEVVETAKEPVKDQGITIGKKPSSSLPSISAEEPAPEVAVAEEEKPDGNALEFNAIKFERGERPLMGIVLEDIGAKGLDVDKLKTLNAPITIAIRTDAPDASERALSYKAAGFEVIAMAPSGRTEALNIALNPNQVKDALNVLFTSVPNAVGLIDNPQAKLQKSSRTSDAVIESFVETGHGLITYAKGLNSVDRSAQFKGVKTAKVARILDENRENKALIARYLDRVSLDAGRDGKVLILGTTAKDTVAALAGWILSSKGQSVSIAPASAVLLSK
ncbi:hypothetical protein F9L33_02700 [Amylibacter sp. SFDW26]|uniref:divergent polysaccharide deacetylase family protein n=1 Tax=Amylibacter sp. SFDW26 TaxID=2652722 RepID=UPI0012628B60|nr:divergent polysaccharide deacetylase family protein [Amylibacter sp. SFDW26]KAB7615689.1 hypothetical protein F9L33_02700 [Amylibacter sp. SFDW26]